jgi:DNA-binding transcriptional ArsR family regulator
MTEGPEKPSKHVCLCGGGLMGISDDPVFDMLSALADKDVLTMVRGLSDSEARSPFPEGLFGLDEKRTAVALKKLSKAGLVSSRRDGPDHVYYLNNGRFRELNAFFSGLIKA